jgi:PIN domain nuclease of toxin-antitoxin system
VNRIVLDTSAILAFLDDEPGADSVLQVMSSACISTVNLAEAYSKLAERGEHGREALNVVRHSVHEVVPFTAQMAEITGSLRPLTRDFGLSPGDRACLALGILLNTEVYTTDRIWAGLNLPCTIRIIR